MFVYSNAAVDENKDLTKQMSIPSPMIVLSKQYLTTSIVWKVHLVMNFVVLFNKVQECLYFQVRFIIRKLYQKHRRSDMY